MGESEGERGRAGPGKERRKETVRKRRKEQKKGAEEV